MIKFTCITKFMQTISLILFGINNVTTWRILTKIVDRLYMYYCETWNTTIDTGFAAVLSELEKVLEENRTPGLRSHLSFDGYITFNYEYHKYHSFRSLGSYPNLELLRVLYDLMYALIQGPSTIVTQGFLEHLEEAIESSTNRKELEKIILEIVMEELNATTCLSL